MHINQHSTPSQLGLIFASREQNKLLRGVLLSRQCMWQLLLTLFICSSVHVLFTWGSSANGTTIPLCKCASSAGLIQAATRIGYVFGRSHAN